MCLVRSLFGEVIRSSDTANKALDVGRTDSPTLRGRSKMPLTMPCPTIPVRPNRTIQLRRMNMTNPDDMQKFITGARTSETRPFVRSQNEAVSRHKDTALSHWYDEQCMNVDKLCRKQETTYSKLTRIELDKRRAEEISHRKKAPKKTHDATEDRGPQDVTARRHGLYPKLADIAEELSSPLNHDLHTVTDVADESFNNTERQREADGKMNEGVDSATNAHLENIKKVESWCDSPKDAVRTRQASNAGHDRRSGTSPDKASHPPDSRLRLRSSFRGNVDTAADDVESTAHHRLELALRRQKRTLDEPFTTYRRARDGRVIVSEVPYRRKKFPMPGQKIPSILPKLRKLMVNETEKNRQRMLLFTEGLIKFDEWDPLQYVRSLRPPEEREHDVALPPPRKDFFNVNDIFNRYYAQLLDGLDPDSAEAMKYCRYIRVDREKTEDIVLS